MKGSIKINGKDVGELGVFILRGGDYDLLTMPERIAPEQNNWYERSVLDVDLSEIFFKGRNLSVNFHIADQTAQAYEYNLNEFYRLLTGGYIELWSREFARSFNLRYVDNTEYNHKGGLYKAGDKRGWVRIEFAMDDPLQLFGDPTILVPRKIGSFLYTDSALFVATDTGLLIDIGDALDIDKHISHVLLNGIDLGAFGIIVNECYNSMLRLAAVKKPLTRTFARMSGTKAYPRQTPTFEPKELVIKCTMRADSRTEFYYNYQALFNNLAKTEALQIESYLGTVDCYYSKMTDFRKLGNFSSGIMVQFTLRLVQLGGEFKYYVLGSKTDTAIVTDANEYILYQN